MSSNKARARKRKAYELLADMTAKLTVKLIASGLNSEKANEVACALTDEMANDWGGQLIYFPIALALRRNRKIFEKFTGNNHSEVASEFGVSEQHVYRVVKIMLAREIAMRQSGLFPDHPEPDPAPC